MTLGSDTRPILEAKDLRKTYGAVNAVRGVSFSVNRGDFCGLLGPNGAGKTTTISMICGVLAPDSGEVRIDGQSIDSDVAPAKRLIGYVPQDLALFEELTATDNLRLFGALYGLDGATLDQQIERSLDFAGLTSRASSRVGTYSGGMKRRLNLASALLHDPQLLILDEPTVGVDPQSRGAIFDSLKRLQSAGKTMLYTTHYMEEVERLCERVVVIDQGSVVANDTLDSLRSSVLLRPEVQIDLAETNRSDWLAAVQATPGVRSAVVEGKQLRVEVERIGRDLPTVVACLERSGAGVQSVGTRKANLEDIFFKLTGRALRD